MHDARAVRRDEPGHDPAGHRQDLLDREPALVLLQDRRELDPVDVGHRDELDAADLPHVVDAHDVRVGDLPGEQELALEALLEVARRSGSVAISGRTILTATPTPSSSSQARYTAPIPPSPRSLMMW